MRFLVEGRSIVKEMGAAHCEVGEMLARRLGFREEVQGAVRFSLEHWDGSGPVYRMKGDEAPVTARIIHMAQVLEVGHRYGGTAAAGAVAKQRKGKDFDPQLVDVFLDLSARQDFWMPLELETAQQVILDMKPSSPFDHVSEDQVDVVCEVIADFIDIRSPRTWNHSQKVATLAAAIGRALGQSEEQLRTLRRAALVHDLGKAVLSDGILSKQNLSEGEWEQFRLHSYYTERILARVEELCALIPVAAAHHERLDGHGYHRGLVGNKIPLGGRILAVADVYEMLSRGLENDDPQAILQQMRPLTESQLDVECFDALVASLGQDTGLSRRGARGRPVHNVSERETEVLTELAKGLTNKEIAKALVISENTVERHLDNIYNKLGVSSRTAAVVWAVHNDVVA